ncbi:MAG: NAD(P)-binding protein [Chloroflexota bacterium]
MVGGGLAGLTAAAYGARAGHEVTLFEKAWSLGGRARTRTDVGYYLNLGPHALYKSGAAAAILTELGVTFTGGRPKQRSTLGLNGKHVPISCPFGLGLFRPASLFDVARLILTLKYGKPANYAGVTLKAECLDRYLFDRVSEA